MQPPRNVHLIKIPTYLFQALPIRIPPSYFKQVQALLIRFVWAPIKPCFQHTQLSLAKQYGGLALPDARKYYQAIHLGRVIDCRRHSVSKLWGQSEQSQTNIPLKSALWCYDSLPQELKSHSLIRTILLHSSQASLLASLTTKNSPLSPILGHPQFSSGLQPAKNLNSSALELRTYL